MAPNGNHVADWHAFGQLGEEIDVPFTNNHAEQILRMLKVRQKISGGFRTKAGAERFLRLRSYIDTARKHELPVFQAIIDAIAGRPFIPVSAAWAELEPFLASLARRAKTAR